MMVEVVDLVKERFGSLTEIQKIAIPKILAGENVLILAPTGSGKCVSGDTVIFTREGPTEIKELYQKTIEVNSLNPELKIGFSKGFVIRKRKSRLFRLVTESGREVKVTDDHKFLIIKDGTMNWSMLKDLKKGDFIAGARKIILTENPTPHLTLEMLSKWREKICIKAKPSVSDLIGHIKEKKNGRFGLRKIAPLIGKHRATIMRAMKNNNIQISSYLKLAELAGYNPECIDITEIGGGGCKNLIVREIDDDFAYFAGLFAGDGNFNRNNLVRFTTSSPKLLSFFKNFCARFGLDVKKDKSKEYDYYVCSKALYVILNCFGFEDKNKSAKIRIPRMFFRKSSLLAAFLRGLFDTDGSVTHEIEYCTKSRQMAKEVQMALLCLGVLSRLKVKQHKKYGFYYRIFIEDSENICKFVSFIGFGHPEKLLKTRIFFCKRSNPNKDIIPNMAKIVKICKKMSGITYQKIRANRCIETYMYGYRNPSRKSLEKVLKYFSGSSATEQFSFLKRLAKSDIFWDRIAEIDEAKEDYVYDATVPGNSNFVGNGIILHNTEAVLLPILEKICAKKDGIRALYITPLRALNRDLLKRFSWWCERLDVSHAVRSGDTAESERAAHRKKPPQILLTTVESLQALLMGRVMRRHLANIEHLIVDEVHDILDNKRGAQLSMGLERLAEIATFQRIGMSATVANESEAAKLIFGERPFSIAKSGGIREMEITVDWTEKTDGRMEKIKKIAETNRSLIFVNRRSTAEELGANLKRINAPVDIHHGSLSKEIRINAEDKFKSGEIKSLVATSSLELGIDIGDVEYVVQYGSPRQSFRLIQRVGRSGHTLEKMPRGIVFADDVDDELEAEAILVRAKNGWIEDKKIEASALDVIAHQLAGICLDFGRMNLKDAHRILSRSAAYGISFLKLKKIALQLNSEGILFFDETGEGEIFVKGTAKARQYYYSNLSTIAKEKRYLMREVSANRIIASLDEGFVMNLDLGASFLAKGQPWRIIDITENEVLVEPSSALDVAIPEWTGEDIPVDFEIAQDVGKLRGALKKAERIESLPDDKTIVIEIVEDVIIIHSCTGTKANEGIARIFSNNISKYIGESVRAVADPYRIIVKLPYPLDEKYILGAIREIKNVRSELEESLRNSFLLKFKFTHVGRLFGLLAEDASVTYRMIEYLRNSVVYEEAVRAIFFRYFDVEKMEHVFEELRQGKRKLIIDKRKELSYFAKLGIERLGAKEAIGGFEPRAEMIKLFRERTLAKTVQLKCIGCGATRFLHLAGAPEKIKCPKCGSESMFTLNEKVKKPKNETEYEAGLVRNFGKWAVFALASYGVGAATADRVLAKLRRSEDEFWWDLVEAQKNFIKNKKYWKI